MGGEKIYKVVITRPAATRFQQRILPYLYENFSFDRAAEIDQDILKSVRTLSKQPSRGRVEKFLLDTSKQFRFILFKETRLFEIKIVYFIDEDQLKVNVTDFFPTRMNPQKLNN